jgi:hypothetical protein
MPVVFVWSHDNLSVICSDATLRKTWKNIAVSQPGSKFWVSITRKRNKIILSLKIRQQQLSQPNVQESLIGHNHCNPPTHLSHTLIASLLWMF